MAFKLLPRVLAAEQNCRLGGHMFDTPCPFVDVTLALLTLPSELLVASVVLVRAFIFK